MTHVPITPSLCPKYAQWIFGSIRARCRIYKGFMQTSHKSDRGSFPDLCQFRTQLRLAHKESAKPEDEYHEHDGKRKRDQEQL